MTVTAVICLRTVYQVLSRFSNGFTHFFLPHSFELGILIIPSLQTGKSKAWRSYVLRQG